MLDTVSPQDVHVTVLNGTTVAQLATTTAASLTARGFSVVGTPGDASVSDYTSSVIEYSSAADLPAARTLAAQLTNVRLRQVPGITPGTVTLILGSSFSTLAAHSTTGEPVGLAVAVVVQVPVGGQPGQELRRHHRLRQLQERQRAFQP